MSIGVYDPILPTVEWRKWELRGATFFRSGTIKSPADLPEGLKTLFIPLKPDDGELALVKKLAEDHGIKVRTTNSVFTITSALNDHLPPFSVDASKRDKALAKPANGNGHTKIREVLAPKPVLPPQKVGQPEDRIRQLEGQLATALEENALFEERLDALLRQEVVYKRKLAAVTQLETDFEQLQGELVNAAANLKGMTTLLADFQRRLKKLKQ